MATLIKARARKPLATSLSSSSWSNLDSEGEQFNLSIVNPEGGTRYTLSLSRKETFSFIDFVAGHDTFTYGYGEGGMGWNDQRSLPEKLRALADKLEALEGN